MFLFGHKPYIYVGEKGANPALVELPLEVMEWVCKQMDF